MTTFFRVLPTDPSYLQLTLFQKFILFSFVNAEEAKKFDMVSQILEYLKPYMNLELYVREKGLDKEQKSTITNVAFDYQSKIGRATGKAQSPKWVREAIARHVAEQQAKKPKKVVWSDDPSILG